MGFWRDALTGNIEGMAANDALRNEVHGLDSHMDWEEAALQRERRWRPQQIPRRRSATQNFSQYIGQKRFRPRLWPLRKDLRWLEGEAARFGLTLEEAVTIVMRRG